MDEKLKAFIKKEIIDTNPIDLKDALVGGLSGVKIVKNAMVQDIRKLLSLHCL